MRNILTTLSIHLKKNASLITVLIIMGFIIVSLFISPKIQVVDTQNKPDGDYYFKHITITQLQLDNSAASNQYIPLETAWELKATRAEIHLKKDILNLENTTATIFKESDTIANIMAPKGQMTLSSGDMALYNANATFTIQDTTTDLYADRLNWAPSQQSLTGLGNVRATSNPYTISSDAFEFNAGSQSLQFDSKVKVRHAKP